MITAMTYRNTAGTLEVQIRRIHHKRWYLQVLRRVRLDVSGMSPQPVYTWREITNRECQSLTAAQARARAAVATL